MFQQQNAADLTVMDLAGTERRVAPILDHHLLVICVTEDVAILNRSVPAPVDKYAAHLPTVNRTISDNRVGAFVDLHVGVGVVEDVTSGDERRTVLLNLYSYLPVIEDLAIFYCSRTAPIDVNTIFFGVVNAGPTDDGLTAVATLDPRIAVAPNLAVLNSSQTTVRHYDARISPVVHFASSQDGIALALDPHTCPVSVRDVIPVSPCINPGRRECDQRPFSSTRVPTPEQEFSRRRRRQ